MGANSGQEAETYAALGITRVIWVEALPEVHLQLEHKIARFPGSRALCACLSDTDGDSVPFHVANNEGQSSSFLEFGTHSREHPTVKFVEERKMTTVRLDTLLARQNILIVTGWFLNIDVQGAELKVLKGMGDLLWRFDHAYIEVNTAELYKGCPMVGEIDDHLSRFGFVGKEVKMTKARWGDKLYQRENRD